MFTWFKSQSSSGMRRAGSLYAKIVGQARLPEFYMDCRVPDSVDGRFDMILLHIFVVMRRLREGDPDARRLSQDLYDTMFIDMDRACREMGIGDLSVRKHIRRMQKAFNGRMDAYQKAVEGGMGMMKDALTRNVYGTMETPVPDAALDTLAIYTIKSLETVTLRSIETNTIEWPDLHGDASETQMVA